MLGFDQGFLSIHTLQQLVRQPIECSIAEAKSTDSTRQLSKAAKKIALVQG